MSNELRVARYMRKIGMAMSPADQAKLNKLNKTKNRYVSHEEHASRYPAPKGYQEMLEDSDAYRSHHSRYGGISGKVIHKVPVSSEDWKAHNIIMSKPYHREPESATRTWVKHPITGWATMASRSLFDSAGLGSSVEDVSVHEAHGVPVTVHRFAQGYETVADAMSKAHQGRWMRQSLDRNVAHKIAALDFLMGNVDRHSGNLLVAEADNTDEFGYNPILAIDHERSFQYLKTINQVKDWGRISQRRDNSEKPSDYIRFSALKNVIAASGENNTEEFRDWWIEVSPKLGENLDAELSLIKDKGIQDHIRRNFQQRKLLIDRWAEQGKQGNYEEVDLFSEELPSVARILPKPRAAPETISSIMKSLPSGDPERSIDIVVNAASVKKSLSTREKLKEVFSELILKLQPEQLVKVYDKYKTGRTLFFEQNVPYCILSLIKDGHNKAFASKLLEYDSGTGKVPPFWVKILQDIAGEQENEVKL